MTDAVKPGDVVQIYPEHHCLAGCFAIVEEVRNWGVVANVPMGRDGIAPVRLTPEQFARIGSAEWALDFSGEKPG